MRSRRNRTEQVTTNPFVCAFIGRLEEDKRIFTLVVSIILRFKRRIYYSGKIYFSDLKMFRMFPLRIEFDRLLLVLKSPLWSSSKEQSTYFSALVLYQISLPQGIEFEEKRDGPGFIGDLHGWARAGKNKDTKIEEGEMLLSEFGEIMSRIF